MVLFLLYSITFLYTFGECVHGNSNVLFIADYAVGKKISISRSMNLFVTSLRLISQICATQSGEGGTEEDAGGEER